MNKTINYIAIAAALLISSNAWAGTLTVPNTFTAGTPAVAAQVNANFTAAKTAVDDNDARITTNTTDTAANATNITALQNAKPGYAIAFGAPSRNTFKSLTATPAPVVTLTMNAPATGFAVVTGSVYTNMNHILNSQSVIGIRISTIPGVLTDDYNASYARADPAQPTGHYTETLVAHAVVPVVAGANIIYLNAIGSLGTGHKLTGAQLTAVYVPNAY